MDSSLRQRHMMPMVGVSGLLEGYMQNAKLLCCRLLHNNNLTSHRDYSNYISGKNINFGKGVVCTKYAFWFGGISKSYLSLLTSTAL